MCVIAHDARAINSNVHARERLAQVSDGLSGCSVSLNLFVPRPALGWSGFAEEDTIETFCYSRETRVEGWAELADNRI